MTDMNQEPAACKVLRKYLPKLSKTLDPSVLATELHSADIVDDRTWEEARKTSQGSNYDRCLGVLEVLIRSTRAKPDCFDKFCAIVEGEEVTKELVSQLREELKKAEKEGNQAQLGYEKRATKRKSDVGTDTDPVAKKYQRAMKWGLITDHDRLFNNLAMDISDKYEEVGLELGIPYKVLRSELESGPFMMLQGHKKATRMLQLWRDAAGEDGCTYEVLAAALEKRGLQRCAHEHCYTNTCTNDPEH